MSQFALKYHKNKTKYSKPKQYIMEHSEAVFEGFYALPRLYTIMVLQDLLNQTTFSYFWMIFCTVLFLSICDGSDSFPIFLNIFFIC